MNRRERERKARQRAAHAERRDNRLYGLGLNALTADQRRKADQTARRETVRRAGR